MKRFMDTNQALPAVLPVFPTFEETRTIQAGNVKNVDWGVEEAIIAEAKAVGLPRGGTCDLGVSLEYTELPKAAAVVITIKGEEKLHSHVLSIENVDRHKGGVYICTANNGVGQPASSQVVLHVLLPPRIHHISTGGHLQVKKGSSVRIECSASGNPTPNVTWSRKNNILPNGEEKLHSHVLSIENVDRHKGGVYICTANNGVGQPASSQVVLHVLYPPEISVERAVVFSGEGHEAMLVCIVHGETQPEVVPVIALSYAYHTNGISDIKFSASTSLLSKHEPMFISRSETFKFVAGDTIVLPCEVENTDPYVVAWKRGIAILTAGSVKVTPDPRVRLSNRFNLQIRDAVPQDAGDYICQIATMEPREITHTVEILETQTHKRKRKRKQQT
ncbi:lachesin-like [Teleopsis dalmanni]|uniref:lachesin-like n=1 Tax=Teleopsis dalmanni TaxID=139649 RepID=UPI0018CE865B|nr:lachesin-like [Teleopsis dalmanni]